MQTTIDTDSNSAGASIFVKKEKSQTSLHKFRYFSFLSSLPGKVLDGF